jgi:hypothetical protein
MISLLTRRASLLARGVLGITVLLACAGVVAAQPTPAPLAGETVNVEPDTGHAFGLFAAIRTSMFGKSDQEWTPLTFGTFFREGWTDAWIAPPNGSGGALRQGWINTPDAFFNRMLVGVYSHTNANRGGRDEDAASFIYETPITRRYMFGIVPTVIDHLGAGGGNGSVTQFGDTVIENRFLLHETQDVTLSFNLNVRVPTGERGLGNDRTTLNSYLAYWFDVGHGWSIRGAAGVDVPIDDKPDGRDASLNFTLSIGQTITPHDVRFFGDFTYYLATNYQENLGTRDNAFISLTPGFRTHLGNDWYLLGGVEFPVNGPRAFNERITFVLVKGF